MCVVKYDVCQKNQVPYTFEMPQDVHGLAVLLTGHSVTNQRLILERLIACYSVALDPSNR